MADRAGPLLAEVQSAANRLESLSPSLSFRVDEGSGRLVVQTVDRRTGEVLREAPPEKFLDLAARLLGMAEFFLEEAKPAPRTSLRGRGGGQVD
jgi:uncharacterized FlaG/YvyC family protein